jgi:hypothetical protein
MVKSFRKEEFMANKKPQAKLELVLDTEEEITTEQMEEMKKKLESAIVLFFPEVSEDAEVRVVAQYKKRA